MKLFKKALLATAIFGAMGVQAADVTNAVTKTSKQGLEVLGVAENVSVRAIVREQLEAGDQITLTFGKGVTGITSVAESTGGAGNPSLGSAVASTANNELGIIYGSGTYELAPISVTTTSGVTTVVLEVKTGDPVTKDSSFEIEVPAANIDTDNVGTATVTYSAVSALTGKAIDTVGTNKGSFIVLADQYSALVKQKFDAVLVRTDASTIKSSGENEDGDTSDSVDSLVIDISDNQKLLSKIDATTLPTKVEVTLSGDFEDYTNSEVSAFFANNGTPTAVTLANVALNTAETQLSFEYESTSVELDDIILVLKGEATDSKFNPGSFEVSVELDYDGAKKLSLLDSADAGEIKLDATLLKVPYFPVGYTDLDTSVHFSNENSKAVNVIMTAFDDETGTEYETVDMGDLPAEQVTKFSQSKIKDALGIAAGDSVKLSVTFNIDATAGSVKAYAFSRDKAEGSRQSLSVQ